MSRLAPHPLADIFPLLEGPAFDDLVADVREHKLREDIVLHEGMILDGRNRYRACLQAKVEPRFRKFDPKMEGDPLAYVISLNLKRRHLNESQRAMVAAKLATARHGGDRRSDQAANLPVVSQEEAAKLMNVSERSVRSAVAVRNKGTPELKRAVEQGKIKVDAAAGLVKKDPKFVARVVEAVEAGVKPAEAMRRAHRAAIPAKVRALPEGKFRVLYVDPPWEYGNTRQIEGYTRTGVLDHYATMSIEELVERDVSSIAAPDSVLMCWATFPLLPGALDVVKAWGFEYKTAFVWDKERGQFGSYHDASAELLIVATRGSCTAVSNVLEKQVKRWPRPKGHSRKPEEARAMIDRMYPPVPGKVDRVELFARGRLPKHWRAWGAEASEAKAAA
jgi:N6-adenosine-specific RNA methylase IME4/anti-sigma28 factor (negative regulator of flagellin synthesis)